MRKHRLLVIIAAIGLLAAPAAQAQVSDGVIKIGVLTDMSSLYADLSGQGSVIAARMAVEDFGAAKKGMKVEIVSADHQNKADADPASRGSGSTPTGGVIVTRPTPGRPRGEPIGKDKVKASSGPERAPTDRKACCPTHPLTYYTWRSNKARRAPS